ncbi:hypothetical protein L6452_38133 [Arctium lappa]|uniref:Uncharacterized protein n=1 Tax=Arctium lappa TaxID=4217 RepID=A0ACB8Y5H2_ARCLA|nr:hypothetical protein L6452_38133 [Arctium lappa]
MFMFIFSPNYDAFCSNFTQRKLLVTNTNIKDSSPTEDVKIKDNHHPSPSPSADIKKPSKLQMRPRFAPEFDGVNFHSQYYYMQPSYPPLASLAGPVPLGFLPYRSTSRSSSHSKEASFLYKTVVPHVASLIGLLPHLHDFCELGNSHPQSSFCTSSSSISARKLSPGVQIQH